MACFEKQRTHLITCLSFPLEERDVALVWGAILRVVFWLSENSQKLLKPPLTAQAFHLCRCQYDVKHIVEAFVQNMSYGSPWTIHLLLLNLLSIAPDLSAALVCLQLCCLLNLYHDRGSSQTCNIGVSSFNQL